MKLKEQA